MSDLDRQLEEALAEGQKNAPEGAPAPAVDGAPGASPVGDADEETSFSVSRARPVPQKRNLGLLLGLLALGGVILTLVFTSIDQAAVYSVGVDQLLGAEGEYKDKNVRVEGDLVKGTLRRRAEPCEYRFTIERGGKKLPVRYAACVVPDTFRDAPEIDVQVTAEGQLTSEGYLEATHIMAKCPSRYEMESKAAKGEVAPHQMPGADSAVRAFDPGEQ